MTLLAQDRLEQVFQPVGQRRFCCGQASELFEKLAAWFKEVLFQLSSIGELTKIGDFDSLTFFGDQGKNRSPRGEDLFCIF